MAKYTVPFSTGAYTYITVEADSAEEAVDKAMEEDFPTICAQCSGWGNYANNSGVELGDEWDPDEEGVYEE